MGAVICGKIDLTEAAEEMKQETRRLAKRQVTWFRQESGIRWHHPEKERQKILQAAVAFVG
jgi:tRNA dimethylallyltransferase